MKLLKTIKEREYWPRYVVYFPVFFYRMRLSAKSGSMMFQYLANPGMPPVEPLRFSKWHILKQLPQKYVPKTYLVTPQTPREELFAHLKALDFVAIIKPDLGERANGVKKVTTLEQLITYLQEEEDKERLFLLQEFISYEHEYGVMRYRFPTQEKGNISGIVEKVPLKAIGDGKHTLRELIQKNERLSHYTDIFFENHGDKLDTVLEEGEKLTLSDVGNHCKGARFFNTSDLLTEELLAECDAIASHIDGFHFGRYDFKVPSVEDFQAGKNIMVLEVNGIQSEPAHIYDSENQLSAAYKELFQHRKNIYTISKEVRETTGLSYNKFGSFLGHVTKSGKYTK